MQRIATSDGGAQKLEKTISGIDFNKSQPKFAAKTVGNESSAKKPPRDLQRLGLLGEFQLLVKRLFNLPLKIIICYMQWIRPWANPQYFIFDNLS